MEKYMKEAIKQAKKALNNNDVPIGAVIVKENKIIARAYNKKESLKNAIYHAEILAISKACKKINSWRLDECTLYVTVEPCLMCAGAILQSRISKVVYGTKNTKFGYVNSIRTVLNDEKNNHKVEIKSKVCEEECRKIIVDFFKKKR